MSESKIEIKVGIVEFSGQGDQDWLATQLDKILLKVPELLKIEMANPLKREEETLSKPKNDTGNNADITKPGNLATWLKEKGATSIQTKKFLAAAAFLQLQGKDRITTSEVTQALKKSNQTQLGNASDSLNQNVSKGHCQKDAKSFYVTPEGFEELGIKE